MTSNEQSLNNLVKRIKLLELENQKLRKENEVLKKKSRTSINDKENKSNATVNTLSKTLPNFNNNKSKGCTCKGNCSNKNCGCMKRNFRCNETCKCNAACCKNKEKNKKNLDVTRAQAIPLGRKKSLENQNVKISNEISKHNNIELREKNSHQEPMPTCSYNNNDNDDDYDYEIEDHDDDDVFHYTATNSNLENPQINAVKKLTFISDEDTLDGRNIELSAIEELEEHEQSTTVLHKKDKSDKNKKSTTELEKNSKQTKKKDSNKNDTNSKKSRKNSNSKRILSDDLEIENLPTISNVTLRSRHNKRTNKEKGDTLNLESIKSTGVTSCIKSISKKTGNSDTSLNNDCTLPSSSTSCIKSISKKTGNSDTSLNNDCTLPSSSRLTRNHRNNVNSSRTIDTDSKKQSKLRRSSSSELISREQDNRKVRTKINRSRSASRESLTNEIDENTRKSSHRSSSADSLVKRKFLPSGKKEVPVAQSSTVSQSLNNADSQKLTIKTLIESPVVTNLNNSDENADQSVTFDPMRPTRQLPRSPIPPVKTLDETSVETPDATPAVTPASSISNSPPIVSKYLFSQGLQISSPPPEILEDLKEVEVDPVVFSKKLVTCRKCKRSFFPHRIQLHEVICSKK
ncbi:putative uncharacterized protein DDB_G0282133 [Leptopilina heterotoma]|uniref:putative uncharacterized protein DDB_G0282133 n=1 Tax=Leptopilina heterotoma TaxID=63436 RepID=UPI001CA92F35|nr:putative uncharacterized protein DDB_G0282133 [Leptopilina heterotoma]XP_043482648.1 putative uncharacterized protein DDB_G0282133 [Leptopilina heterotoma]